MVGVEELLVLLLLRHQVETAVSTAAVAVVAERRHQVSSLEPVVMAASELL